MTLTLRQRVLIMAAVIVVLCAVIIIFDVGQVRTVVRTIVLPGKTTVVTETKTVVVKQPPKVKVVTRVKNPDAKIDPSINAVALRKLCQRRVYRDTQQCRPYRKHP